jgi:SecD/SecF fusion protein
MFVSRYVVNAEGKAESSEDAAVSSFGIQSSQKVGPSVADDITLSAIISVCFALLVIGLYILLRFRNISYSVGAVASLAHDTIVIMGIFSLFQNVMPFSLEIDQAFIAAILTVIGYSINDNVVVFDRIRENISNSTSKNEFAIMNGAMNSTLSRTFSTSMSTAIVLIIIFIFGGEVIRGFVFAMLVGVIVGTYSTLFVACPISYDLIARKNKGVENASKEN